MIRQVGIKNFKSFGKAVVNLERFTVLVGPNGAGKSNFVDALRFIGDCLTSSVSQSLQNRGGLKAVRRQSVGHPTNLGFDLSIELPNDQFANFSFEIASRAEAEFEISQERCRVGKLLGPMNEYEVQAGKFTRPFEGMRPAIEPDRLALTLLSGLGAFRPVYDYLTAMRFYSIAPNSIRELQEPDAGKVLKSDGGNAAAVLREIRKREGDSYERLCRLLEKVVPGTKKAEYAPVGQKETIRFKQNVGAKAPWAFDALSMSDGTLRVFGILLAMYQISSPTLIAIEEPEATIHPAALEVLVDILKDGATRTQILITTHSPELIDSRNVSEHEIRAVESDKGQTTVAELGLVARTAIRDRLYSPGELLRSGEIEPDREKATQLANQPLLFTDAST